MARRRRFAGVRRGLSEGLGSISDVLAFMLQRQYGQQVTQENAANQDRLARDRERARLVSENKLDPEQELGEEPSIRRQLQAALEPTLGAKSPTDIQTDEEFNLMRPRRVQPILRPEAWGSFGGGAGILGGDPQGILSATDPDTTAAVDTMASTREKFRWAQPPTTRRQYDPELGAEIETEEQFDPFAGAFRPLDGQRQATPTGEQRGVSTGQETRAAREAGITPEEQGEDVRRGKLAGELSPEVQSAQARGTARTAAATREATAAVDERRGIGDYKPIQATPEERVSFDFSNRFVAEHNIMMRLEPALQRSGQLITLLQLNSPNLVQDPTVRQYASAAKRAINAQLRRDSGAAISAAEYKDFGDVYGWRPGDDPTTVQQKQAARRALVTGQQARSGALGQVFVSLAEVQATAQALGVSVEEALAQARREGYKVVE